ncbi:MAG TPA: hypothetical protein ENJ19_00810 [Gammaproteobacteria bacterium]|nr:hypothetical protein [Gammaproteobacteria bacterium]
MAELDDLSPPPYTAIKPGLICLGLSLVLNFIVGFYVAFHTPGIGTLIAWQALVIVPTPYYIFAALGFILTHMYHSTLITRVFNVGGLVIFIDWFLANFYAVSGDTLADQLRDGMDANLIFTAALAAVFCIIMLIVAQFTWDDVEENDFEDDEDNGDSSLR